MAALWAALCYGLPSFGLSGAGAMLAHAHDHGGSVGLLLVAVSIGVLIVVMIVWFRREPERTLARALAEWGTIGLAAWAGVVLLEWGHAWVVEGGTPRRLLLAVILVVVWLLVRLAYRIWRWRRARRSGLVYVAPDEGVREGRWR